MLDVAPDMARLCRTAAEHVAEIAAGAIGARGRFTIALAGGSTPRELYGLLATPAWAERIEWRRAHVFFGDERCVPPVDRASNYGMAREALLAHVPVPEEQVHRVRGEDDPPTAAEEYEHTLRTEFAAPTGPPRPEPGGGFDLALFGMGENGHTASLFPHRPAVREAVRWVVADAVAAVARWRVTLTPVVLNASDAVLFLVAGKAKAGMLRRVLEGPRDPDALPVQAIAPRSGRIRWMVDAAAASELRRQATR